MTTVTGYGLPIDLGHIDFSGFDGDLTSVYRDTKTDVVVTSDLSVSIILHGNGFGGVDSDGYVTDGTVTSVDVWTGHEPVATFLDFSVDARDLAHALEASAEKVVRLLFDGNDHMIASDQTSKLFGYDGNDVLSGGPASDRLVGGNGTDTLTGGKSADHLQGDGGADTMTGGKGADTFVYSATSDSITGRPDTIAGLHDSDIIDLSAIDANTTNGPGDDAFALADAFTLGVAGQLVLHYVSSDHRTRLQGDVNGDATPDFTIYLSGKHESFIDFVF